MMKFNRLRKTKDPCPGCSLHKDRCICAFIPTLDLKTRLTLVIHAKELKRTTNTGTLALKALVNSDIKIRGQGTQALDLSESLSPKYQTYLFYPSDDAVELTQELTSQSSLPVHLIVPDGNWRQASKVHYRHSELKDIVRVKITTPNLSLTHLRAETTEYGMATLHAIALALGIIEGPEVQALLMKLYEKKLEQTLIGRGLI